MMWAATETAWFSIFAPFVLFCPHHPLASQNHHNVGDFTHFEYHRSRPVFLKLFYSNATFSQLTCRLAPMPDKANTRKQI